jgi:hypothetical protein
MVGGSSDTQQNDQQKEKRNTTLTKHIKIILEIMLNEMSQIQKKLILHIPPSLGT